jgi:hypothetical protein
VLLQRGWEGDQMLALRDVDEAVRASPGDFRPHFHRVQVRGCSQPLRLAAC